jgi:hypothetical protein
MATGEDVMIRPRTNQIEIGRTITPGGADAWSVIFRDLYFGPRQLERHWTKPDAVRAAERLSRKMRVHFERGRRQKPEVRLAERTKFAAWEKRQQRVAQRAAKRGVQP